MVFEFTTYFKRHFINIRSKFIFSKQKVLNYSSINFIAVECLNRLNYVYFIDLWKFYLKLNNNIYTNINFF
ncbi:hypothetical protein E5P55_00080 [Candidatus Pinguicoccus supinus]|uniref:Uncharacterized protein n=1 Tax=Candidatus Pinguicoccus supinus TaxID=2529394 RepID=A0A7T0FY00_9BACT|nr:hypothetical protein E5P55_00080 [Candidatus Pinguicoccus supinus]